MTTKTLQNADLIVTPCSRDTRVEIEGPGTHAAGGNCDNLLEGIWRALWVFNGAALEFPELLKLVTILEYDPAKKFLKVRIANYS